MIEQLYATRYVTPLREGGSLPAIVEANNGDLYVMKFVGAGQGPKALIAELLGGQIAQAIGLLVPQLVLMKLDPLIGRNEGDPEIRHLLQASVGLNLGMRVVTGALPYSPLQPPLGAELASKIVWLDAYISNVDRTPRNVNMLCQADTLWLIDHGAAFYFHHSDNNYVKRVRDRFPLIKHHVLLPQAAALDTADQHAQTLLSDETLTEIAASLPDDWLALDGAFDSPKAQRRAYAQYLIDRLAASREFVEEAQDARANL